MQVANESLGQKALNGTMWVFLERIALELFRFITTIVLARLLGPKEFGLIALTSIFLSLSLTFIDSGFTKALIQKKNTTVTDESTIFYFNLIISLAFVLFINVVAGMAAEYYSEPRLENILRALSITLILFAFRQIQQVVLTKSLNFKLQFKANVTGTILSGIIGIILAYKGMGVWALVIQAVLDSAFKTVVFWIVSSWRPTLEFSKSSFKELYKFGINLFVNDLLKSLSENMYGLLIGKYYNPYNLGLYDRANKLAGLVITNFQFSIQKVTFPLFAKVQDDKILLRETVKKSLDLILFLVVPSVVILATVSEPLTILLLTDKWVEMVPYVQLFCIYWVFFPFSGVNNHLVLAMGYSNIVLKQSFIIYGLQFVFLMLTVNYGIILIITGQIVATIVRQILLIYYADKLIKFGFKEQGLIFLRHLVPSLLCIIPALFLPKIISTNYILLILQSFISLSLYLGFSYLFKSESLFISIKQLGKMLNLQTSKP